ncbi:MAG: YdiU family protein [Luminiphilus sp.]|nr:YdiU family protein [Luminiphilus sp.]
MFSPQWQHSYQALGSGYTIRANPDPASSPEWMGWNETLAEELLWPQDLRKTDEALAIFAGQSTLEGTSPTASVYAGHQFGQYNPQLGDGRAILLGEWAVSSAEHYDVQLKGAGQTPYSRGGDGKSPVGPVVREYLVSEAMHHLGVPTTRALAAIATGDRVFRNDVEPGAVMVRVAKSHLRFGSIQYFAMTREGDGLAELVEYAAERHFPDIIAAKGAGSAPAKAEVLLEETVKRIASLVAHWQSLGFVHGVMNTDNMLLSGETIDYGPCAFVDTFKADAMFSAIDSQGRYRLSNQPGIAHWNTSVLASCLLKVLNSSEDRAVAHAQSVVDEFPRWYTDAFKTRVAAKLGLDSFRPEDTELHDGFLKTLEEDQLDLSLAYRWLTHQALEDSGHTPIGDLFVPSDGLLDWQSVWQRRRASNKADSQMTGELMRQANPVVIPRNHHVAAAIEEAEAQDYDYLQAAFDRWKSPFEWQDSDTLWAAPPTPTERVTRTFCGT